MTDQMLTAHELGIDSWPVVTTESDLRAFLEQAWYQYDEDTPMSGVIIDIPAAPATESGFQPSIHISDQPSPRVILAPRGTTRLTLQTPALVFAIEQSHVTASTPGGNIWANHDSTVAAGGWVHVYARDNSRVTAHAQVTVTAWDNSHVTSWGTSRVKVHNQVTFAASGRAHVEAFDEATGTGHDHCTVRLHDEAGVTVRDTASATHDGSGAIVATDKAVWHVSNFARVRAYDNSQGWASGNSRAVLLDKASAVATDFTTVALVGTTPRVSRGLGPDTTFHAGATSKQIAYLHPNTPSPVMQRFEQTGVQL